MNVVATLFCLVTETNDISVYLESASVEVKNSIKDSGRYIFNSDLRVIVRKTAFHHLRNISEVREIL